jgi:hypothetical protein
MDPKGFYAYPDSDPSFHFFADPDPTVYYDANLDPDTDPAPRQSNANLRPLVCVDPPRPYYI